MNLNHFCKETSWFLTMEDQKTLFIPLSKYVTSSKQLTHEEEEGSVIKYFREKDLAGQ